jgi:DNA topoisomerase-1
MKRQAKTTVDMQSLPEAAPAIPAEKFLYEVSKRPRNRHKKLNGTRGESLITPSGARVPPAWTDVWMTTDPASRIQAIGRDSKGRRVYLYSAEHMGMAAAVKFSRLKAFDKVYPYLIKKIGRDMKTSEEALVLYLISKTGFRIGGDSETLAAVKAFGASTLRCSQVSVQGNQLLFNFVGKKGIRVSKNLNDAFLARGIAGRCDGNADQKIFRTSDNEIRAYLNTLPKGSGFMVKDFRTYIGTITAFRKIKTMPVPRNSNEFKKYRREVGETVARILGNSPTIALKSYVSPEVFCAWESGHAPPVKKVGSKRFSLEDEFLDCVHYDQPVPVEKFMSTKHVDKLT